MLLSIDTLRADHLGFYGYELPTSPHLDRLAREGIVFDQAVAVHTNTAPSHASILTGLYPATHGIVRNGVALRRGVPTLATILGEHGYRTAIFASGWTLQAHTGLKRHFHRFDVRNRNARQTWEFARNWLAKHAEDGQPFFLFLHFFDPHMPYNAPAAFNRLLRAPGWKGEAPGPGLLDPGDDAAASEARSYARRYDAEIAFADRRVGRLLDDLDKHGVASDTIVVFVSDHGETLVERPWILDHGGRLYDEQLRVPLVFRLPSGAHAGSRVAHQVSHVDVLPTLLELLNFDAPPDVAGRSLVPFIGGGDDPDPRPAFSQALSFSKRVPEVGARLDKDRLMRSVRTPGWKLIEYPTSEQTWHSQLFDLAGDPGETRNVAAEHPERVDALRDALEAWYRTTGDADAGAAVELPPDVEKQLRELGYAE